MTEQARLAEDAKAVQKRNKGVQGLTTDEVRERLRAKYEWPEWMFYEEVPFHDPHKHKQRLADAVAMPTYQSQGYLLHGFEIKVTRSDWLHEMNNPAKAEATARHVDRFWLVIGDPGIASDEEVPPDWGIIKPYGKKLRVQRQARALRDDKAPLPRQLAVTMARKAWKQAWDTVQSAHRDSYQEGYKRGLESGGRVNKENEKRAAILQRIEDDLGLHFWRDSEEDWGLKKLKNAVDISRRVEMLGVDRVVKDLQRYQADVGKLAKELESLGSPLEPRKS